MQRPGVRLAAKEQQMPKHEESSTGKPGADKQGLQEPGKIGVTSDDQPDLVAPSGVNEGDHGAADMAHPRGKVTGTGRTWDDKHPSDAGELGAPGAGMSDRNGPSDPDAKRDRNDRNR
jgi:hypothetical protein